ncbi:Crp/Fnr family transcriptional regulator [Thalassotalea sp. HSM 43]|uniref:Crp/Fnr family transcriptional regulator n=1 Tax=Thalassotalea sp. HSM 43 TaxID=2552945 RepID=UPI001081CCA8|nr:Crp/Fnr family transcriptional regulator [Thalassotalea sp. HSM 43]QBY03296.1 Crp/Fnr family transcriptional regulator [Thalassotalea sp. HSM 43]
MQQDVIEWPCELSKLFKESLLDGATKKSHSSGNKFNIHHQQQYGLYYVLNGSVMMTAPMLHEDNLISKLYGKGDWFCYAPLMNFKFSFGMQGQFLQKVEYIKIPLSHLNYLLSQSDELFKLLFFIKSERADTLLEKCLVNAYASLPEKVAYSLLDLYRVQAGTLAGQRHEVDLQVTQQQIGQLAAMNRARVNTTIQSFSDKGIIEPYRGGIKILDIDGLRREIEPLQLLNASKLLDL